MDCLNLGTNKVQESDHDLNILGFRPEPVVRYSGHRSHYL